MKNLLGILCLLLFVVSCSEGKKEIKGETAFQRKLNAEFKDASKSPLTSKDLKTFDALAFFPVDDAYKVVADFTLTPNSKPFQMATTTERVTMYRCYGIATFTLNGETFSVEIYQDQNSDSDPKNSDELFLPFTDETNGFESYGGGRYIDLEIPKGNTITIDFNRAYNPYCAYNERFSCPIPPRVNFIPTEIKAGVKAFKKSK